MEILFRRATIDDLPEIVRMLADDLLGVQRERYEDPLPASYIRAFREIEGDPNSELIVAELSEASDHRPVAPGGSDSRSGVVVGALQLTFTPSISFQGGKRAMVESVRVDAKYRGQGIGERMMQWAIERAKEKGCVSMQLTTSLERTDAHRFYERLGFSSSHLGMKLKLR